MDLSVLNLFASVGATSLAKAFGEVDTGPPDFGGPPLVAVGPQKEVANEPNAQAQVLDLLKLILKADAPASHPALSPIQPSPDSQAPVVFGFQLGDERYAVEKPGVKDVLAALGVKVPEGFDPEDGESVKKVLAEAIVGRPHPAALAAVLQFVIASMEGSQAAAQGAPQRSAGVLPPAPPLRNGDVPLSAALMTVLPDVTYPLGHPVASADAPQPAVATPLPSVVVPLATAAVPRPTSEGTFSTGAKKVDVPAGAIDPKVTKALGVVSLDVDAAAETIVEDKPVGFAQTPGLQKAPTRPAAAGERSKFDVPAPVGRPVPVPQESATEIGEKPRPQQAVVTPHANALTPRASAETPVPVVGASDGTDGAKATKKPTPAAGEKRIEKDEDATATTKEVSKLEEPEPLGRPTPHVSTRATEDRDLVKDAKQRTLDVPEIRAKVVEKVQELAAMRGSNRVTIRLQPEDFGTITVAVRAFGDGIEAKVSASNDEVRHALHTQRNDLVQSVESKGLSLNSFTVGKEPGPDAWQQQRHGNGQGQDMRQEFARSSNVWSARHDQSADEAGPRFSRLSAVGLDTLA